MGTATLFPCLWALSHISGPMTSWAREASAFVGVFDADAQGMGPKGRDCEGRNMFVKHVSIQTVSAGLNIGEFVWCNELGLQLF